MVNQFITKLLKIGRDRPLSLKHQLRVQLALGLPTFEMVVDKLVEERVATWLGRCTSRNETVAERSKNSIKDLLKLSCAHPL